MATTTAERTSSTRSSVVVTDDAIQVRIPRPDTAGPQSARAATLAFAARADSFQGLVLWHRYEAIYALLVARMAQADANGANTEYTRVYDPLCQVAASYAVAAGVRQRSAEHFVEAAQACFEKIPTVGRLLRDGLITPAWFTRVVEQTSLVIDPDLMAFLDAEIAHRLSTLGGLTSKRVEDAVKVIVAEHDPDAVMLTREEVTAQKNVIVNPLNEGMSEVIVTTTAEDAILIKDALDAVIAGVCPFDPRTRGQLRSDAAAARLTGAPFVCACGREDCAAELSDEAVAARCARVVLHVVARKDTLDGTSTLPALLDGYGPISADHARELAARPDAVRRELNLDELMDHQAQPGNPYRPTAALDTAARAVHGTCSWVGCDRPAWKCDLDHVTEFNHADPAAGGATCACNLNPKCKFHHGLKTHAAGWLDDQIVGADGVIWTEITTPEGLTVRKQAANGWLIPELGLIPCSHGGATRPGSGHAEGAPEPGRARTRLEAKHRYRMRQRAANRRAREAAIAAMEAADGEPPF
ncbi:DUF222 domain-containing protein [Gordonia phthalatica]|uniref:DUF222 domain-containing protein n=1 Tax=Gordonia phthalatica TaxID=1136941 RepID=A0A0N9NAU4_9ACTN|nr:DUF222 domain-containing protein [Gordonia phthalatica]ALG85492.1 hypothetical protein ACH46_14700 [Gordonia phthalatica]